MLFCNEILKQTAMLDFTFVTGCSTLKRFTFYFYILSSYLFIYCCCFRFQFSKELAPFRTISSFSITFCVALQGPLKAWQEAYNFQISIRFNAKAFGILLSFIILLLCLPQLHCLSSMSTLISETLFTIYHSFHLS